MARQYVLHGWQLSYFSAKLRAYLRYKQIDFRDNAVDAWTLMRRIPRRTGAVVMPVLVTPHGEWLQDTSHIIETLETRIAHRPVLPATPVQRMVAFLLELWADEWWIPMAMHYRWSYPENYKLFEDEAAAALLPHVPRWISRRVAATTANRLRSYLPGVGVVPAQFTVMERWTTAMLDALNVHFQEHCYLLGARPTLADFALVGPLYAHLGRDPWPKRELVARRAHLHDWIERVHAGGTDDGALLADDAIAETLTPMMQSIVKELWPMVRGIRDAVSQHAAVQGAGKTHIPRMLGMVRFPMADDAFARGATPYTLWMAQRIQRAYRECDPQAQERVRLYFAAMGNENLLDEDLGPELRRKGLRAELA